MLYNPYSFFRRTLQLIIYLLLPLLFISCAVTGRNPGNMHTLVWRNKEWLAHGAWEVREGSLIRSYTWEEANYLLLKSPDVHVEEGILSFSIDVFNTVDIGFLFGIEQLPSVPPYIPENCRVVVIRNQDIYFNQRINHQWQSPQSKVEVNNLAQKRLHVIIQIQKDTASVFLYDRDSGSLITKHREALTDYTGGTIGFYSYIAQDIHTSISSLELHYDNKK